MSVEFNNEAKQRIISLGSSEITSFIEELPQADLRGIYKELPKVDGFRRNSSAEFKEKHRRFLIHLVRQTQQRASREWSVFAKIWEVWAEKVLKVNLPDLDEREGELKQAIELFNELKKSYPYLSREEIEKLYTFSGFSFHNEVDQLISTFKSESDIKLERMMAELPLQLTSIESKVKLFDKKSKESIKIALDCKENLGYFNESLQSITNSIGSLEEKIFDAHGKLDVFNDLNQRLELVEKSSRDDLSKFLTKLSNHEKKAIKKEVDLQGSLEVLRERVGSLENSQSLSHSDEFNALSQKVISLENKIHDCLSQTSEKPSIPCNYAKIEHKDEVTILDSQDSVCAALATNLQTLGFNKQDSKHLARQVFATLASGLIVQFSGSLADLVADVVALAVGGARIFEWKVPVGLIDSSSADSCLEMANQFGARSFVLKGANLSAFEVYGSSFRETVMQMLFSRPTKYCFPFIVSLKQGASVFPNGGMISELGPVIHTDDYKIRDTISKKIKIVYGETQTRHLCELLQVDEVAQPVDIDEFQDLLGSTDFKGGNLWNRSINTLYQSLRLLSGGTEESDFKTVLMLYALPWAEAKGASTEAIVQLSKNEWYSSDLEEAL